MALKVAVSPFFGGDNWTDELTGITFEKSKIGAMAIYDLSNVTTNKLDGVRKALRLNALTIVEGSVDEAPQAEPVKAPVKEEVKEEVKVEVPAEEVEAEEPKEEEVKKPARKGATK